MTMPNLPDQKGSPDNPSGPDDHEPTQESAPDALPKPIQEHLGRQLRSAYNAQAEKPAFLGDPVVPPQFERLIRRIEVSEKVREIGVEAVRQALEPGAPLPRVRTKPKEPEGGA
jgi:hypothetical protein